jgi:hypothetical protein
MNISHYIGFDVHKKSVSYCVKTADGKIVEEGTLKATHEKLRQWAQKRQEPWHGAMEATLFSGWIYDTLKPFAQRPGTTGDCLNVATFRRVCIGPNCRADFRWAACPWLGGPLSNNAGTDAPSR